MHSSYMLYVVSTAVYIMCPMSIKTNMHFLRNFDHGVLFCQNVSKIIIIHSFLPIFHSYILVCDCVNCIFSCFLTISIYLRTNVPEDFVCYHYNFPSFIKNIFLHALLSHSFNTPVLKFLSI